MNVSTRIRWIAATTLGLATVGLFLHFPGGGGADWEPGAGVVGAVFGAITGAWVGYLQWLLLRDVLRGLGSAVLSMAVGIGLTHAVADATPVSLGVAPAAVAGALVLTAALALAYRERRPLPLVASFLGWSGGLVISDAVGQWELVTVITGLVWGGVTAAAGFPSRPAIVAGPKPNATASGFAPKIAVATLVVGG